MVHPRDVRLRLSLKQARHLSFILSMAEGNMGFHQEDRLAAILIRKKVVKAVEHAEEAE